jgi:predicted  nucleic acid-binding Zn-ribbon protein
MPVSLSESIHEISHTRQPNLLAILTIRLYNHNMNQVFFLAQMQKVDTTLDATELRLAEIQRIIAADKTIASASKVVADAAAQLTQSRQTLRQAEDAVQAQRVKIELTDASLYSGKIQSPKELRDLQADLVSLKKHLATLEDLQFAAMVAFEDAEEKEKSAQSGLTQANGAFATQKAALLGEQSQLMREKERLLVERGASAAQISPELLSIYQKLRSQKRGLAIARINDGDCTACGSELRPAEIQAARSPQSLTYCSSCGRILYAG